MTYRKLTPAEIATLEANDCRAEAWNGVEVAEGFSAEAIHRCRFAGTVRLGRGVRIDGVHEAVENYEIGDNVQILNVESLRCRPGATFGGGVQVGVLNESGGREIPIYPGLTAQIAALAVLYRHRPEAIQALTRLIEAEIREHTPALGRIGAGTRIAHCGTLTDVCVGEQALLQGVAELTNGTIESTPQSSTVIGRGVIARDFIISDSSEVTDYAQLSTCFVGQGCRIGRGFTADNCLFFANCDCQQGEAQAVFAGPYTVTHHKSTLLIGGMFSFFNAGSGTNQSNHLYRLGPLHQGILERGSKCGSNSYMVFPARVGAYSVVLGKHSDHPDTAALPFSLLIGEGGATLLVPGTQLRSIGLARDVRKWPERERRRGTKRDHLCFDLLTPYTIGKILGAIALLEQADNQSDLVYNRATIPARSVAGGLNTYRLAVKLFVGEALTRQLTAHPQGLPAPGRRYEAWSDLSGLILPTEAITALLDRLPAMASLGEVTAVLDKQATDYEAMSWNYAAGLLSDIHGKPFSALTPDDLARTLAIYQAALAEYESLLLRDAAKEFAPALRTGYDPDGGTAEPTRASDDPDGEASERDRAFTALHGTPATHPFVQRLCDELRSQSAEAQRLIEQLR
jgi:hypothetical protein